MDRWTRLVDKKKEKKSVKKKFKSFIKRMKKKKRTKYSNSVLTDLGT